MSRTLQLTVIAFVLALAPLVILYEDTFLHELSATISFIVFALSAGYLVYSTKVMLNQDSETSEIGLPGVVGLFSLLILGCSIAAVVASVNGSHGLSVVLSLLAVGIFIVAQFAGGFTSEYLDKVDGMRAQRSGHGRWSDRLGMLAPRCSDAAGSQALRRLQERCRFLARDSAELPAENAQIESLMGELASAVAESDAIAIKRGCEGLEQLFDSREASLKRQRSKI